MVKTWTLQVLIILGQGGVLGLLDVLLDLLLPLGVHGDLRSGCIKRKGRLGKQRI